MADDRAELSDDQSQRMPKSSRQTDALCPSSPWMTPEETAGYLGIALGTLRNWTSARFIPHAKKGRVVRYHRDLLDKWLSKGACPGRATLADV